ncbi:MAG: SAF domain protein [Firmicutes bacterium ADurb.Bin182]|nr:MAG: SAF domain protein [Firmicutes bacterium ADurb.Bin182]
MKKFYAIAAGLAVLAGFSVYLFASSLQAGAEPAAAPTKSVVVALKDIPEQTLITNDMVAIKELPLDSVHPGAAVELENVVGSIAVDPIVSGEQVLEARLGIQGVNAGSLSFELEKGHRAVSVAVNEVTGVSGFIEAGDHVDVIALVAYPVPEGEQSLAVSTMLVENVLVLKTGHAIVDETDAGSVYKTVTLSVKPEDALKIDYAESSGAIRLILRPVLDDDRVNPKDFPVIKAAASVQTEA